LLEKIQQEYEGRLELVKIDADAPENEELMRKYDVRSIPTLVLINGDEVIGRMVGAKSESELKAWINIRLDLVEADNE
jgi:thioredoxin 2